ncbi:COesterase domain-containing protein [Fusarium sp. LHS14.1]|nr:COesterase domain-containing protein [Fusarium sp. LHS14.1]
MHTLGLSLLVLLTQTSALVRGIDFARHADEDLPLLKLPWGSYEGCPLPEDDNIYLFQDVRFGAKPELFSRPEFPPWIDSSIQPPLDGRSCILVDTSQLDKPPGGENPIKEPFDPDPNTSEDCLFLDLYVPKSVVDDPNGTPVPVVVWIHGGAFAFGSKNRLGPIGTGQSILRASKYQTIFVAGNYRLGAYGWLAGDYMQNAGQTNAGLYDQALLFDWVQLYIDQVNGDKDQVSALGESAGASSILHHLIRERGTIDPTFSKFAVQSPAFEWAWDNSPNGQLDKIYENFSELAGCGRNFDIDCLRSSKNLSDANQALFSTVKQTGLFPIGPAVDDFWVKTLPTISFANDDFWKEITSTIISHTMNEAASFALSRINSSEAFDHFLASFLPGPKLESQRQQITEQYNCTKLFHGNYSLCITTTIRDAAFTCNTRDLYSAYPSKSHMIQYGFPSPELANHATDLLPLFANSYDEVVNMLAPSLGELKALAYAWLLVETNLSTAYQTYFASFAASGDPNGLSLPLVAG